MITFSDALRECQKAVLDTNLDEYASEITIIRDVKGKVRLMADGVAPSDLEACQAAEIELARRLGVYWEMICGYALPMSAIRIDPLPTSSNRKESQLNGSPI